MADLSRMRELARLGHVDYRPDKTYEETANRCDLTYDEAKLKIRTIIQGLTEEHFDTPGRGKPYPPCDVYLYDDQLFNLVTCCFEPIRWYVKIGIAEGVAPRLWVESCHPEARP